MKTRLLMLAATAFCLTADLQAQTIKNGSMESWQTTVLDNPDGWETSNSREEPFPGMPITVTRSSDSRSGMAIRLETHAFMGDFMVGFFTNSTEDPEAGDGGMPYSQQPTHITGYYKSDIKPGDSALVLVVFKKNGAVISQDIFKLHGVQNTYTQFSFPLSLASMPDSVVLAAASSNAIDEVGIADGSYVIIDDLAFSGPGITQAIPGGNFDNWSAVSTHNLNDWVAYGEGSNRSSDSYKGSYSTVLETIDYGDGFISGAGITNAEMTPNGTSGGVAYDNLQDTLVFWYKYTPQGGDSAVAFVSLTKNTAHVGGAFVRLPAAASYTKIEMILQPSMAPDTLRFDIASSMNGSSGNWHPPVGGSKLWVDEVQLASEPLNTGVRNIFKSSAHLSVYPNPFNETIHITLSGNIPQAAGLTYTINDITGKRVDAGAIVAGTITSPDLNKGVYFVTVFDGTKALAVQKIVKE